MIEISSKEVEMLMQIGISKNILGEFVLFLEDYYTEVQILKLFDMKEEKSKDLLFDVVYSLRYRRENIDNFFVKISCELNAIHAEFIRCSNKIN